MSLPNNESYALHIIFQDGGSAQFYSRDFKKSKSKKRHPEVGLKDLMKLAKKHEHNAQNIDIYDHQPGNPDNGTLVFRWNRGKIKVNNIV